MENICDDVRIIKEAFRRKIKEIYVTKYPVQIKKINYEEKKSNGIFKATIFTSISPYPHEYTFGLKQHMNEKMCTHNMSSNEYYNNEGIITYEDIDWDEYIEFSFDVNGITYYGREELTN